MEVLRRAWILGAGFSLLGQKNAMVVAGVGPTMNSAVFLVPGGPFSSAGYLPSGNEKVAALPDCNDWDASVSCSSALQLHSARTLPLELETKRIVGLPSGRIGAAGLPFRKSNDTVDSPSPVLSRIECVPSGIPVKVHPPAASGDA